MRRTLLFCVFLLAGCGFAPLYGDKGGAEPAVKDSLSAIAISPIPDYNGQFLRNALIDRLYFNGRPHAPKARLNVKLTSTETNLGIQKDATSTRSQLTLHARYNLVSTETSRVLTSGAVSTIVGYSILEAQYGTLATQRDAYKRGLSELSEQLVGRLSLYYAEKAPFDESPRPAMQP